MVYMFVNNYFNYTNHRSHDDFIFYLLSFAMEQYKEEDPMLSNCAQELIRYILKMDQTEKVVVTELVPGTVTNTVIVNNDKCININTLLDETKIPGKKTCLVCYDPSAQVYLKPSETYETMYLSMKKLKEICGEYQSRNQIFLQYIQYLNEHEHMMETTLHTPIEQWKNDDYRRFILHLLDDSIIDMTGTICGGYFSIGLPDNPMPYISWRYLSADDRGNNGMWTYVNAIYLHTHFNTIDICINPSLAASYEHAKKMKNYVNNICPMPIAFDLSNYKEKIQYAESIFDQLVAEFEL